MTRTLIALALATTFSVGSALASTASPQETFETARKLQIKASKQGNEATWTRAARAFEDFLALYPEHRNADEARFGLAECLLAAGDLDGAWQAYQDLRATGHREADVIGGEAFVLLARIDAGAGGEVDRLLIERVKDLLRVSPGHDRLPPLLIAAAQCHRRAGELDLAESAIEAALDRGADGALAAQAWDDLGAVRFDAEDWQGAIRAHREYMRRYPDGSRTEEVRCLVAYAHLRLGDDEGAVLAGERLLEILGTPRGPDEQRLWNETVKIVASARLGDFADLPAVRREVVTLSSPWSLDVVLAALALRAADGDAGLALDGLDVLSERELLDLDLVSNGLKAQFVSCCYALRDARPDSTTVHRWLLVAASALDSMENTGEAGELLQWLRNNADDPGVRRQAREQQLRGVE